MKIFLSENIKRFRNELDLSQDRLAEKMGVTPQAVSKWETGMSWPDVEMLFELADFFGTTVDFLVKGESAEGADKSKTERLDALPDDDTLRIVMCRGTRILRQNQYTTELKIPIEIKYDDESQYTNIEVWGNADIEGDIHGEVSAGCDIHCKDVQGSATAGCDIQCVSIQGRAEAGCDIHCGDVRGDVDAGCDVRCKNIYGSVDAGCDVKCAAIEDDPEDNDE